MSHQRRLRPASQSSALLTFHTANHNLKPKDLPALQCWQFESFEAICTKLKHREDEWSRLGRFSRHFLVSRNQRHVSRQPSQPAPLPFSQRIQELGRLRRCRYPTRLRREEQGKQAGSEGLPDLVGKSADVSSREDYCCARGSSLDRAYVSAARRREVGLISVGRLLSEAVEKGRLRRIMHAREQSDVSVSTDHSCGGKDTGEEARLVPVHSRCVIHKHDVQNKHKAVDIWLPALDANRRASRILF